MSSIFSGADEARLMGKKTPRIGDFNGVHVVKVKEINSGVSAEKKKQFYSVACAVVKTNNTDAQALEGRITFVKNGSYPEYFFSEIKYVLAALTGRKPEEIKQAAIEKSSSPEQKARGRTFGVRVTPKYKNGKRYPEYEFFAADEGFDVGKMMARAANDDAERSKQGAASRPPADAPADDEEIF